jgi:hypothetical protein
MKEIGLVALAILPNRSPRPSARALPAVAASRISSVASQRAVSGPCTFEP